MKKVTLGIIVAVLAIGALVIVIATNNREDTNTRPDTASTQQNSTANNGTAQEETAETVSADTVVIKDFAFGPSTLTVKKGTTVKWTNQDEDRHDITPDEASDDFQKSELLSKGESYEFTFNTLGTYAYHCTPHPYMKGTVVVTE